MGARAFPGGALREGLAAMNMKLSDEAPGWMAEAEHALAAAQWLYGQKCFAWSGFVSQRVAEQGFTAALIPMEAPAARRHATADLTDRVPAGRTVLPRPCAPRPAPTSFVLHRARRMPPPGQRAPFRVMTRHQADDAGRVAASALSYRDEAPTRLKALSERNPGATASGPKTGPRSCYDLLIVGGRRGARRTL